MSSRFSGAFSFFGEFAKIILLSLLIVVPIRVFLFQPFMVRGESMSPNFEHGDYLIVDELSYRFHEPFRGEVIIFKYPKDPREHFIKRVIGLPGETVIIENGKVMIEKEGKQLALDEGPYLAHSYTQSTIRISLEEGEYFVLGDNRAASSDSRSWGPVTRQLIVGRAWLRALPWRDAQFFNAPAYVFP